MAAEGATQAAEVEVQFTHVEGKCFCYGKTGKKSTVYSKKEIKSLKNKGAKRSAI